MDEDEMLYREMNEEDDFYMGNKVEPCNRRNSHREQTYSPNVASKRNSK